MDSEASTHSEQPDAASNEIEMPLPAETESPGRARAAEDDVLDDITLIVSELVSNAVQHGEPDILLRMRMDPLAVDISVLDHGTGGPPEKVAAPSTSATSGRGLSIVDRLASDWGVVPLEGGAGKTVWARLLVSS
jgi:anti-sigma regulatory factor (Ser/Thr protein kinase)